MVTIYFLSNCFFDYPGENYKSKEVFSAAQHWGCVATVYLWCCWYVTLGIYQSDMCLGKPSSILLLLCIYLYYYSYNASTAGSPAWHAVQR